MTSTRVKVNRSEEEKKCYSIIINSMPKGVNNPNLTVAGAGAQLKIRLKLDTGNPFADFCR